MDKQDLIKNAECFVDKSEDNYITNQIAISDYAIGTKIFESPIFACGAADDEYFTLLKQSSLIGKHFMLPKEWLPQAKTVISFFLPFTAAVKKENRRNLLWPTADWLFGRMEGQTLLNKLCVHLKFELINAGYNSLVPALDKGPQSKNQYPYHELSFTSNWPERHVAFICGLGTFALSKGLISQKGIAGRFGSIITELHLPPDKRDYKNRCTR